jgi:four helix bundle protein
MDYRELAFYQKARMVVKQLNDEINTWPNTLQSLSISRQLFRAATSIGANIAEGHGRHTGLEYIHYLVIARGSANEVDHWLNTAIDCKVGNERNNHSLIDLNNETRKMLSTTINTLQRQQSKRAVSESPTPYPLSPYSEDIETELENL